jgi:glycosyltransferase involved in cell wall biosynthesis
MKKVTIIINCHNGAEHLENALSSIKKQTFSGWEILFCDNQSQDRSADIAKNFDGDLHYFRTISFISLGEARAISMEMAKTPYLCYLDVDDLWHPEKIEDQLNLIESDNYSLVYSGIKLINLKGEEIGSYIPRNTSGYIFPSLLKQFDINMVTPMINLNFLRKNNLNFSKEMKASEEYNLFMKMAAISKVGVIKKIHGYYRVDENSLTNQFSERWHIERKLTLEELKTSNPELADIHSEEFNQALSRGIYYHARYLVGMDDVDGAKKLMANLANQNIIYFLLNMLLNISVKLWKIIHRREIKEILGKWAALFFRK